MKASTIYIYIYVAVSVVTLIKHISLPTIILIWVIDPCQLQLINYKENHLTKTQSKQHSTIHAHVWVTYILSLYISMCHLFIDVFFVINHKIKNKIKTKNMRSYECEKHVKVSQKHIRAWKDFFVLDWTRVLGVFLKSLIDFSRYL